jgi:8-oxo-dGTP pyrophosphatase MutT (NUDIX family)
MSNHLATTDLVAARLRMRLDRDDLPGTAAQLLMSQRPRRGWKPGVFPKECRQAAVLVLTYPLAGGPGVVLTQRRHDLPVPGGEVEAGESLVAAALREAHEEIGIESASVHVLGALTPLHVPISNFVLHPIVGVMDHRPAMRPEEREVARILEPRIAELADPERQGLGTVQGKASSLVPYFLIDDLRVWGATAMVLAEFLSALDLAPDPWSETAQEQ